MATPAESLLGLTLGNYWIVIEKLARRPYSTGGHFSEGYLVEGKQGERAFLKALDLSDALRSRDVVTELLRMTQAYSHERDLYDFCRDCKLDRIVVAVHSGQETVGAFPVPYLIFELAQGDVRTHPALAMDIDLAWRLRSLHNIATGLQQLHGQDIVHQDLKPSNVLVFDEKVSKLADLGRASKKGSPQEHDGLDVAGDLTYAPPELLYGYVSSEWNQRRFGCDAYHLGSMVVFFFTGFGATALILSKLDPSHHPRRWSGDYADVLVHLRDAFGSALSDFKLAVPDKIQMDIVRIVTQLCHPDPSLRGHPGEKAGKGNPYSLRRYVTELDYLARKAELRLFRTLTK